MLNNWRSDIGKAGHSVVVNFWNEHADLYSTPEERVVYVKSSLHEMRFVYRYPNMPVSIILSVTDT